MHDFYRRASQLVNALRYLGRGDIKGLINRLKWHGREYSYARMQPVLEDGRNLVWGILCDEETLFIAQRIAKRLAHHNMEADIILGSVQSFNLDFYIILSSPLLKNLPPPGKRFIFQLEQSVSSNRITPEYIELLKDSLGVLECRLTNIEYFSKRQLYYPKVHYLPLGANNDGLNLPNSKTKKYDFLVRVHSAADARTEDLLSKLQQKYSIRICHNIFGEDFFQAVRECRVVLNLHNRIGDLLEASYICECISLGTPVLSEESPDQDEFPELDQAVHFFKEDSAESMLAEASRILTFMEEHNEKIAAAVAASSRRFDFMMDRFLVAAGIVPTEVVLKNAPYMRRNSNFFALSLPETIERRIAIANDLPKGFELFDGIRNRLGWVGCAASFKALALYSLSVKRGLLTVIEDDADLPKDFLIILDEIGSYLHARHERWDIFSGMMADVHPSAKVHSVERVGGRTYVTIDKITSTVFNIYNDSAVQLLSQWDPSDTNAATNTIDRYMERQKDIRVVVAIPFIAGHKEDATSTLWGVENQHYTRMIGAAQKKIEDLVRKWENNSPSTK